MRVWFEPMLLIVHSRQFLPDSNDHIHYPWRELLPSIMFPSTHDTIHWGMPNVSRISGMEYSSCLTPAIMPLLNSNKLHCFAMSSLGDVHTISPDVSALLILVWGFLCQGTVMPLTIILYILLSHGFFVHQCNLQVIRNTINIRLVQK